MFNFFSNKSKTPAELCFGTDIHCHIVPGIDDGAPDAENAADIIEGMQSFGIRRIIASPHVTQVTFENDNSTIEPALAMLHAELDRRGNNIEVLHSAEYRIDELFHQRLENNELMLLPNNHILIENSFIQEPWNLDNLVFDLQLRGLVPILAHPERYAYYSLQKNRYRTLHDAGLNFQINLLSLAEAYGPAERSMAEYLIKQGLVDFIGTDIHRLSRGENQTLPSLEKRTQRHESSCRAYQKRYGVRLIPPLHRGQYLRRAPLWQNCFSHSLSGRGGSLSVLFRQPYPRPVDCRARAYADMGRRNKRNSVGHHTG